MAFGIWFFTTLSSYSLVHILLFTFLFLLGPSSSQTCCAHIHVCASVCVYVSMCMSVCFCVCLCLSVSVYICGYVCVYLCACVFLQPGFQERE